MSLRRRFGLSLKIAAIFFGSAFLLGAILPPVTLPAIAIERCFTIGGIVPDLLGLGAHDLAALPILALADLALYVVIVFVVLTLIAVTRRTLGREESPE